MSCPSELTLTCFADGALPADDAGGLEAHLAGCVSCRARVAALAAERSALARALKQVDTRGVIPAFVPRPTLGPLLSWIGWLALASWAVQLAWSGLAATVTPPDWLAWILPDAGRFGLEAVFSLLLSMTAASDAILAALMHATFLVIVVLTGGIALWLLLGGRVTAGRPLCLVLALSTSMLLFAPPGHAIELRHDEDSVTIPATETIDDTLVIRADRVLVEGTVTGDLIVAAEDVTVRGSVGGTLIAIGERLNLESEVNGNVLTAGETMKLRGARIGGNLYGAGSELTVDEDTELDGNAAVGAGEMTFAGLVGRDLWLGSGDATLSGRVLGSVRAYGKKVSLTGSAKVGGDLYAKVTSKDDLSVDDGAEIAGATTIEFWPEETNPYLTFQYYLGIVLKLAAAFIAGLVLFELFPGLSGRRIHDAIGGLTAAGLGAVVLVATPILAVIAMVTLIGAPLGIIALLLYCVALYVAGLLAAKEIGAVLLDVDTRGQRLSLLAGLVVTFLLINLP
ncbi:MAG: zf-HC2 domain-containing protein, partial [Pseudomonadales bacterium]